MEKLATDGRRVLKWVLKNQDTKAWTRLIWLRLGASGKLPLRRQWNFRLHKIWGNS